MDIISSVLIRDKNVLNVSYQVPYGEGFLQQINTGFICGRAELLSQAQLEPAHVDKLRGKAFNPIKNDSFRGSVRISDCNLMNVKTFLVQPPAYTISFSAVKDTYTKQSKPNLNYGNLQTMVVGRGIDGEYIGFVEIDISQLTQYYGMNWLSLKLVFNRVELAGNQGKIDVYECYTSWYEYYLTYLNQVTISSQPLFSVDINADRVTVDVKSLVKTLLKQGKTRLNLVLKSNDYILLKTRETGQGITLEFKFSDPYWIGYADEKYLPSQVRIRTIGKRDWYSVTKIRHHNHLKGQVIVKNPAIFENKVYVNKAFITSNVSVVYSSYLPANVIIRQKANSDIISSFTKVNSEQVSKGVIKERKDIVSSVQILPEFDIYDFGGGAEINRTFLLSSVLSVRSIYLNGSVVVRQLENSNLQSQANINQGIFSKVIVIEQSFRGSVIVRNNNVVNIESRASITPDLKGKVKITGSHLIGSIFVRYKGYSDLNSKSEVPPPSDIVSQLRVRQKANNDLLSQGRIRRKDSYDIIAETNILNRIELLSQSRVRRYDDKDLISQSKIRRYGFEDIEGQTEVYNVSDITGQFEAYLTKDLNSQARIRQFDVEDKFSHAYIDHGYYVIHLVSSADVKVKFKPLISYATINSNARLWRPNVEGGLKFNRKLPRVWRREDFIKDF